MRKAKPPSRSVGYCTCLPQTSAESEPGVEQWLLLSATPQIGFSPKTKTSKLGMKNTPASIHWPNNEMMCVYLLNMKKSNWVCLKMGYPKFNELPFSTIKLRMWENAHRRPERHAPCTTAFPNVPKALNSLRTRPTAESGAPSGWCISSGDPNFNLWHISYESCILTSDLMLAILIPTKIEWWYRLWGVSFDFRSCPHLEEADSANAAISNKTGQTQRIRILVGLESVKHAKVVWLDLRVHHLKAPAK